MPELSKDEAHALIEGAVASLLDPSQDVGNLGRYFAPDCWPRQHARRSAAVSLQPKLALLSPRASLRKVPRPP